MKNIMKLLSAAALAVSMLLPIQASAKLLFGSGNAGVDLVVVDSITGAATRVAAFSPAAGQFAVEFTPDGTLWALGMNNNQLYTVDVGTAAATPVGTPSAVGASFSQLASDSNGNLYATTDVDGILYSIDKVTGQATAIGDMGLLNSVGISFDQAGVLYAVGQGLTLNTVDPATGTAAFVASITGTLGGAELFGLAIDQGTGIAYMVNYMFQGPSTLYTLNLTTGAATPVAVTGVAKQLDLAPQWPDPVFTPPVGGGGGCALNTQAGLDPLLPVLALLAIGFLYRRRNSI